jgi:hypothetical protein
MITSLLKIISNVPGVEFSMATYTAKNTDGTAPIDLRSLGGVGAGLSQERCTR